MAGAGHTMRSMENEEADPAQRVGAGSGRDAREAIDRFLAQPPEHGVGDGPGVVPSPVHAQRSFWQSVFHFLFEKEPSQYSSIAPRKADGTRTKPFFFNGNGRGR